MYGHNQQQQLTSKKYLMSTNAGVMLVNVQKFLHEWPNILRWGHTQSNCIFKPHLRKQAPSCRDSDAFPPHDQGWLNQYYMYQKGEKSTADYLVLPPTWNWKVYWDLGRNSDQVHQVLSEIRIVHFHGPKPDDGLKEIATCDTHAAVDSTLVGELAEGICCDQGKMAALILRLNEKWKPKTKRW